MSGYVEDGGAGSGEVDDEKAADQYLTASGSDHAQKTIYIASTRTCLDLSYTTSRQTTHAVLHKHKVYAHSVTFTVA